MSGGVFVKKKRFKAVELNHLNQEIIGEIREWRNQDFVRKTMFTQKLISEEEHLKWIEMHKNDDDRYLFVCYLDNEPIGVIQYVYRPEYKAVETGYYLIDENYQYMGYGVIMAYFMGEIVFCDLGFERVFGRMMSSNTRAVRLDKFLECQGERVKDVVMIDGVKHEVIMSYGNRISWEQFEKPKLIKLISKIVDLNYDVIM